MTWPTETPKFKLLGIQIWSDRIVDRDERITDLQLSSKRSALKPQRSAFQSDAPAQPAQCFKKTGFAQLLGIQICLDRNVDRAEEITSTGLLFQIWYFKPSELAFFSSCALRSGSAILPGFQIWLDRIVDRTERINSTGLLFQIWYFKPLKSAFFLFCASRSRSASKPCASFVFGPVLQPAALIPCWNLVILSDLCILKLYYACT